MSICRNSSLTRPVRRSATDRKTSALAQDVRAKPVRPLSKEAIDAIAYHFDPLGEGKYGQNLVWFCSKTADGVLLNKSIRIQDLRKELPYLETENRHVWFSQNAFKNSRRTEDLVGLRACYVDIDCYKAGAWVGIHEPEVLAAKVRVVCQEHNWPEPSEIIFSGQGLQVVWILARAIPKQSFSRWKALQKRLIEAFLPYGADGACVDASRILRVPGTINLKSGCVCRRVWPENSLPKVHFFDEQAGAVLRQKRMTTAAINGLKKRIAEWQLKKKNAKVACNRSSTARNAALRESDCWTLWNLRQINGHYPEGGRETLAKHIVICMAFTGELTLSNFDAKIEEVMDRIDSGWQDPISAFSTIREKLEAHLEGKTVVYDGVERPVLYTYKTDTICDELQITDDESVHMKVLKKGTASATAKYQKKTAEEKLETPRTEQELQQEKLEKLLKKLETPRTELHQARLLKAQELYKKGWSQAEIGRELHIDRSTVCRILKETPLREQEEKTSVSRSKKAYAGRLETAARLFFEEGYTVAQTAEYLGVNSRTARYYLKKLKRAAELEIEATSSEEDLHQANEETISRPDVQEAGKSVAEFPFIFGVALGGQEGGGSLPELGAMSEKNDQSLLVALPSGKEQVGTSEVGSLEVEGHGTVSSEQTLFCPIDPYVSDFGYRRFSEKALEKIRAIPLDEALRRLGVSFARNEVFKPMKDSSSKAYDVQTAEGFACRLVVTGLQWTAYLAKSKSSQTVAHGGGAIDLAKFVLNDEFTTAVKRLCLISEEDDRDDEEARRWMARSVRVPF